MLAEVNSDHDTQMRQQSCDMSLTAMITYTSAYC